MQFQAVVWRVVCCSFSAKSIYFHWGKYFLICGMDKMWDGQNDETVHHLNEGPCCHCCIFLWSSKDEICRPWSKRPCVRSHGRRTRAPLRGSGLALCCQYPPATHWPLSKGNLAFMGNLWHEVHSLGGGCRLKQQEQTLSSCHMLPNKWQFREVL